jgi:hypothetical protein
MMSCLTRRGCGDNPSKRAGRVTPPAVDVVRATGRRLAAAVLIEGESESLTRKAVELALAGDPVALRLCIERILPVCRERAVRLALPPIKGASDVSAAANAVTSALARGALTPGEAERIAIVVVHFDAIM